MGDTGKPRSSSRGQARKPRRAPRKTVRVSAPVPPGPPWEVKFHPEAVKERTAVKDKNHRQAIMTVAEKLKVHGPTLAFPHQSAVQGDDGKGLRELRPAQGRTPWRGIYRRFENTFVILSVGPEANVNQSGFGAAVKAAQKRRKAIEDAL